MSSIRDLSSFIKQFMEEHPYKTNRAFAERYSFFEPDPKKALDPSIISRLLTGKAKPSAETLKKLAVIVLDSPDATKDALWEIVKKTRYSDPEEAVLRIGTGFTTWSSFVLSMINLQHNEEIRNLLQGVKFVFCNDGNIPQGKEKAYWVKSKEDIEVLRTERDRFREKFIANDLQRLLNNSVIDCAILLRPTFEAMQFPLLEQRPILLSRILVGNGTHMYAITKRNETDFKENENINIRNASEIMDARLKFCTMIQGKNVRMVVIGNKTINDDKTKLLRDPLVLEALTNSMGEDVINNIGDNDDYKAHISRIGELFETGRIDVLIVVGFAPVNHIIYRDVLKQGAGELDLVYKNFNLSKMVEEKASYGMYGRIEVIRDLEKLKKIRNFLNAMQLFGGSATREALVADISNQLADLYYDDEQQPGGDHKKLPPDNINKVKRMTYDLGELEYSNRSLPLINLMIDMLEEAEY